MIRVLTAVLMLACCLSTRTVAIRSLRPNSNRDGALEPETFVEINHGRGKLSATEEVQSLLSTPADGIRQLVKDLLTKPEEHFIGPNAARFRSVRSRGPEGAAVAPDSTSEPPLTGEEAKPASSDAKPAENSGKSEAVFGAKETPYTMELQQHKESGGRDGDLVKLQAWLSTASQAVQRAGQLYSTLSGQLNNAVSGAIAQKQSMLNWITEQKSNAMQRIQQIERQVSETALQIEALQAAYSQAGSKRDAYANRARQMVAERQLQTAQPISPAVRAAMTPESEYQQQLTEVQNQAKSADDTMKQAGQTLKQAYATVAGGKAWLTAAKSQLAAWLTAQQATVTQRVKNGAGQSKGLQSTLDAVDRVFNQAQVLSHVYHLAITQAEIDARLRYLNELNKLSGKNSRTFTDPSVDTVGQDITQLSGIRGQVTGRLKAILDKYELQGIIGPLKEWDKVLSSVPPLGGGTASLATMPGFGGINLGDPSAAYRSPIISDAAFSPRAGFDPSLAASTPFNIQSIGSTPTGLRDMPQVGAAATFAFSSVAPYIGGAPSMPTQLPPPPQISNLDLDFGGSDPLRNLNSAGLPTLPTSTTPTVPPASVPNLPPPPVVPQVN